MRSFLSLVAAAVLLAGCATKAPVEEPGDDAPSIPLTAAKPSFTKNQITPTAAGANPLEEALGKLQGKEPAAAFTVPVGTGRLQLAIDFGDPADTGQPQGQASLSIQDPSDKPFYDWSVTSWQKVVRFYDRPTAGDYTWTSMGQGNWKIGLVASFFPEGYTPGFVVNISKPEQTQVEHKFYPSKIRASVGEPARVTLFDYDPHYGIENDQHNWAVPELDLKTEGRTHWGEVYTLDFTPTKKGKFDFQCDYHKGVMTGTLTVV